MTSKSESPRAEVVLRCDDLDAMLAFVTKRLDFRLDVIFPADDPTVALVSGYGVRLRIERRGEASMRQADSSATASDDATATIRLLGARAKTCSNDVDADDGRDDAADAVPSVAVAPNGTRFEFVADGDDGIDTTVPPLVSSLTVMRLDDDDDKNSAWIVGRAGMLYRDLIPDRLGGRFVASHIRIPDGGPVPDFVHYHDVRFQMIYCARGWVRVVYEDQGDPFVLRAGDCVLQPPRIRHRVLESSDGLEVVEIGCPAIHATRIDHEMTLPTDFVDPSRVFPNLFDDHTGGQRFVRHQATSASWSPSVNLDRDDDGNDKTFEFRDTGIADATHGLADVRIVRCREEVAPRASRSSSEFEPEPIPVPRLTIPSDRELHFMFVLDGEMSLRSIPSPTLGSPDGARLASPLRAGDAVVVPPDTAIEFANIRCATEWLEVTLPART